MVLYSVAMRYEFGVGHWLQRHPLLYAITHMAITPLMALYVASFAHADAPLSARIWPVIALATCATVAYELGRKTWAPEQEHADADSYSRLWGTTGAGLAVLVAIAAATAASVHVCRALQLAWATDLVIGATGLAAAATAVWFMRQPTARAAKLLGLLTSLLLLVDLSAVAIAVAIDRGLTWGPA